MSALLAAATALSVAGPQDWHRIAKRMGVRFAVLVDEAGTVYVNPAAKKRLRFVGAAPARMIISPPL